MTPGEYGAIGGADPAGLKRELTRSNARCARQAGCDAAALERASAAIVENFLGSELAARFARVEKLGREQDATGIYQKVLDTYPDSPLAARASGRLQATTCSHSGSKLFR